MLSDLVKILSCIKPNALNLILIPLLCENMKADYKELLLLQKYNSYEGKTWTMFELRTNS